MSLLHLPPDFEAHVVYKGNVISVVFIVLPAGDELQMKTNEYIKPKTDFLI
jgi:hypothetical protein